MFNHFQMFDDLYDVIFEITEGANVQIPIKIKLSRTEQIYDSFDQKFIDQENSITFMNNAFLAKDGE